MEELKAHLEVIIYKDGTIHREQIQLPNFTKENFEAGMFNGLDFEFPKDFLLNITNVNAVNAIKIWPVIHHPNSYSPLSAYCVLKQKEENITG